ncbi:MAG: hypothetical protein WCQ52_01490 [Actinomycetes bacterium]
MLNTHPLHMMALTSGIHASSSAVAALAWWIVPILAVLGAIVYVVWVSKFKQGYENKMHRSVSKFNAFQESFKDNKTDLK